MFVRILVNHLEMASALDDGSAPVMDRITIHQANGKARKKKSSLQLLSDSAEYVSNQELSDVTFKSSSTMDNTDILSMISTLGIGSLAGVVGHHDCYRYRACHEYTAHVDYAFDLDHARCAMDVSAIFT